MFTSTSAKSASAVKDGLPIQAVKLLSQREDYSTCHVCVPGDSHRLAAISLDGKFYSFLRFVKEASKAIRILQRLSEKGRQAVLTPAGRGYAIWGEEPTGTLATRKGTDTRSISPTFGPADCWIIGDRQPGFRTCSLKVPDLPDIVPGLAKGQKLFSLYRREKDAETTLKLASRLSQRGDEVVLLTADEGHALCIYEPGATVA